MPVGCLEWRGPQHLRLSVSLERSKTPKKRCYSQLWLCRKCRLKPTKGGRPGGTRHRLPGPPPEAVTWHVLVGPTIVCGKTWAVALTREAIPKPWHARVFLRLLHINRQSPQVQHEPLRLQPPPEQTRHLVRINSSGQSGTAWPKASGIQKFTLIRLNILKAQRLQSRHWPREQPDTGLSSERAEFGEPGPAEFVSS